MSRDSHKKCPKNAEKGRKIPELVPNFIRSVHYFNRLLNSVTTFPLESMRGIRLSWCPSARELRRFSPEQEICSAYLLKISMLDPYVIFLIFPLVLFGEQSGYYQRNDLEYTFFSDIFSEFWQQNFQ